MTFPYNPVGLSSVIKLVSQYLFACSLIISMVVTIGRDTCIVHNTSTLWLAL